MLKIVADNLRYSRVLDIFVILTFRMTGSSILMVTLIIIGEIYG